MKASFKFPDEYSIAVDRKRDGGFQVFSVENKERSEPVSKNMQGNQDKA